MRVTTLLAAVAAIASPAVLAAENATYIDTLITALQTGGYTKVASALHSINSTANGNLILNSLSDTSKSYTIFLPNDHSWVGVPSNISSNANLLAGILGYHIVPGTIPNTTFATAPGHTILRTILNDTSLVNLGNGLGQVLVVYKPNSTARAQIYGQNTRVSIVNSTTHQNLLLHTVNAVIDLPPTMTDLLSQNFGSLKAALTQTNTLDILENAKGVTVFAPSNQALAQAQQQISGITNQTQILDILQNHVINGTAVYSSELSSGSYMSAAGEPFTFSTNSSGTWVTSGNSTARIITSDLVTNNGVVHVIDGVLLNTARNDAAASSAYQSATSTAASATTQVGPIGSSIPGSSGNNSSNGNNGNNGNNGKKNNAPALTTSAYTYLLSMGVATVGGVIGGMFVL